MKQKLSPPPTPTANERSADMKFIQYYLDCLSHASYLIADESTGRTVVVDPQRNVAE